MTTRTGAQITRTTFSSLIYQAAVVLHFIAYLGNSISSHKPHPLFLINVDASYYAAAHKSSRCPFDLEHPYFLPTLETRPTP
ncbi:hypothetical protein E2C01_000748 [Portunus trituberculatus]|uniref:Uncharacterized protein n=1 Tax=Portunus trituberculatus TaxID=210409 RepID=A0A5B7CHE5_PORTR|nr:hypothetical protein [Portunus trituberculatus]